MSLFRFEPDRKTSLPQLAKCAAYAVVAAIVICLAWQSVLTMFAGYDEKEEHQNRMNDLSVAVENIERRRAGLPEQPLPSGFKTQADEAAARAAARAGEYQGGSILSPQSSQSEQAGSTSPVPRR